MILQLENIMEIKFECISGRKCVVFYDFNYNILLKNDILVSHVFVNL